MTKPPSTRITHVLEAVERGDAHAADQLLPLVYEQLRALARQRMARERPGQTLQPTALVHEAYLRLIGDEDPSWANRAHFFTAAATAMRRILIERARRNARVKHGGNLERVTFQDDKVGFGATSEDLIALDDALTELEKVDPRLSKIVTLRYFTGLTIEETSQVLGVSRTTIKDEWTLARAWLFDKLGPATGG